MLIFKVYIIKNNTELRYWGLIFLISFFSLRVNTPTHRAWRLDLSDISPPPYVLSRFSLRKATNYFIISYRMAQNRKHATPRDPRRQFPKLREDLRKRVYAMQDACGVCGREVDKALPAGSPMSPELDEIMPVARGGSPYDIDNLQLTHRICNRRKGTKIVSDELPENINPTPNSRSW